jgi:hypothetical protein
LRRKGFFPLFCPGYHCRQRGKVPRLPLRIEEIYFLQTVHCTDLFKQRLIDMTREKQLVDQPGIIHQTLADQILQ